MSSGRRSKIGNGAREFSDALACISEAFYALDGEWRIVAFNAAAEAYFGLSASDVLSKSVWDLFPQGRGRPYEDALRRAKEERAHAVLSTTSALRPGRIIEVRVGPWGDGVCVAIQDLTAREEAERRLALSEERLRLATEGAGIGVVEVDLATGAGAWSPSTFALLGLSPPHDLRGDVAALRARVHPVDYRRVVAEFEDAIARQGALRAQFRIVRADDAAVRWLETVTQFMPAAGGGVRALGVVTDITERKLAEERLRESERRLRFLDRLFDATKEASEPQTIMARTARLLAEHLDVDLCAYADMEEDEDTFTIRGDWARPGAQSIVGTYSLADFGERAVRELRAGRPLISNNNAQEGPRFLEIGLHATLCMPLIKAGKLTALMAIHRVTPHQWSAYALDLLQEVTERSWAHIERVRAEMAQRAEEARYRALFNSIDSGFCVVEMKFDAAGAPIDYVFREMNPAFEHQTGLSDAVGKSARELVPELESSWFEVYGGVAKTGLARRFELQSGAMGRWFDVFAYPVGDVGANQVAILFNDITARKRAEAQTREEEAAFRAALERAVSQRTAELQESEARLRTILQTSHMYQGLVARDGALLYTNATSLHGIMATQEDVVGLPIWEAPWFTATDGMPDFVRDAVRRAGSGETVSAPLTLNLPIGRRHFEFALRPVLNENGAVTMLLAEGIDVTDRIETENALRQAQKLEAMGQLTGGVAHDFNNLLMILSGGLNMLERRDDPARREMLIGRMRDAVERGAKLTQQLLAFSRKHDLAPTTIDFAERIEAMRELLDRSLGGHVRVAIETAPNLAPIYVDQTGLQQALLNLAVNARDAMPEGGIILIKSVNGAPEDGAAPFVSVSVIDTGIGMSADVQARIFEPFFTTKDIGKGSGLGLAQVHGFARQSGGRVEVHSRPGAGTTVTLVLPKSDTRPAVAQAPAPTPAPPAQKAGHALLVEDDDEVAALTGEMMAELGWRITRAASGEAALKVTRANTFDLVFSDIMMPGGMTGVELAHTLKSQMPDLPILLTTGYTPAARNDIAAAGVPVLTKPFTLAQLAAALEKARA